MIEIAIDVERTFEILAISFLYSFVQSRLYLINASLSVSTNSLLKTFFGLLFSSNKLSRVGK